MKTPYCEINGIKHQLFEDKNGTIRFPSIREIGDMNQLVLDYFDNKISAHDLLLEDIETGTSYNLVHERFSTYGCNNHIVTQGKDKTMKFVLYSGDVEIDESYNDDNIHPVDILYSLMNEFDNLSKQEKLEKLELIKSRIESGN
jgi:hypothetical protein